jgi:hypothetical protein
VKSFEEEYHSPKEEFVTPMAMPIEQQRADQTFYTCLNGEERP